MIDAIFIQTCFKEFKNKRIFQFLKKLLEQDLNKTKIYIFCDWGVTDTEFNHNLNLLKLLIKEKNINNNNFNLILVKDDINFINKTSYVFNFIMNFETDKYKKILLLESDCDLKSKNFLQVLEKEEFEVSKNKEYWVLGSKYYGQQHLKNGAGSGVIENIFFARHLNGVAIYNRTEDFIKFINKIFISENGLKNNMNYDFLLYLYMYNFNLYKDRCIDSKSIINISSDVDRNLDPELLKPGSVVIHQKQF